MVTKIIVAGFLMIGLIGFAYSQPEKPQSVTIKQRSDLKKHNGKLVNITGKLAINVMQHPNLNSPFDQNGKAQTHQNYLDTEFGQIVLLSKEDIKCDGQLFVEGKLKIHSLDGKKGTKSSYQNPYIEVEHFVCK